MKSKYCRTVLQECLILFPRLESMEKAFAETINILKSKSYCSTTVVLGNVSCDLDSAVCSVVYAYFLHWQHHTLRDRVCTRQHRRPGQSCQDLFFPVLNVPREDYDLKTEVNYWFKENNISKDFLIFRNDLDLSDLSKLGTNKVVLVDHHILAGDDGVLRDNVTEIIDHRPKDTEQWCYGKEVRVDIQQVGSCASLVCDRIRHSVDGVQFLKTSPECANLLYGTIILDTVNFSEDIKKGTPSDLEQVMFLEELLKVEQVASHRITVLERLKCARSDISNLTCDQVLRKDVKTCGVILAPSFPVLVQEVLHRRDLEEGLTAECARSKCTSVVMMGVRLSGSPARDLAVWCPQRELRDQISKHLEDWSDPPLGLLMQATSVPDLVYYSQANLTASRKQIMPVLNDYLSGVKSR